MVRLQQSSEPVDQADWPPGRRSVPSSGGGRRRQAESVLIDAPVPIVTTPRLAPTEASRRWAAFLRQIFEVDPLRCPCCHGTMRIIACITPEPHAGSWHAAQSRATFSESRLKFLSGRRWDPHYADTWSRRCHGTASDARHGRGSTLELAAVGTSVGVDCPPRQGVPIMIMRFNRPVAAIFACSCIAASPHRCSRAGTTPLTARRSAGVRSACLRHPRLER